MSTYIQKQADDHEQDRLQTITKALYRFQDYAAHLSGFF